MSAGKPNPLNKLSALFPNIVMPFSDNENIRDYIEVTSPANVESRQGTAKA